ncbi:GNAT family N-acetyltransferase [Lentilactobacillus kisonensis]|nr:GNAT family N-acetyltransferase [Lentilactobacillus kisonensis]
MTITIRKCTLADMADLQQISRVTFADTFGDANTEADLSAYLNDAYSQSQLRKELTNPNSQFFFVFKDEILAGYLKVNVLDAQTEKMGQSDLEVQRIYILPQYKRHGLGRKLINQAITIAQKLHKTGIWLGVWENNLGAIAFYQQLGFKQVGDHVFTLGNSPQRDLILEKRIEIKGV